MPLFGQSQAGLTQIETMGPLGSAAGAGTIGQLLGGAGLGLGAGSLIGGLFQRSLGKTGPSPMVGAGLGTAAGLAFSALGGPIGLVAGGLLGGALGGGGGGIIRSTQQ